MRQGPIRAAIAAMAVVAVFITAWVLWPRPATVAASLASHVMVSYLPGTGPAAKANPGRRFVLVTTSTAAGPAVVPANAVVVPAAEAAGRIDQEVTALAGTA